ncbi:WLM-domain-containing protein [Russula earlei]|uniref:WLM-domain-containing protein n=1 Tax=Russula earlei TaxID=71964 RepID=A0ACC0ULD4_9AGAM|nr:WLM-domain-containing protein [Russula earlei]
MVHLRLNENEPNPNPHVNFIAALPAADSHEQERARQLLRALAAQVRPIMRSHGFVVNSLEEYEYNNVFAGRNWNSGETVELVLRRRDGLFVSTSWLMGTLCHELAHIKHMNHGPDFQALWSQLRKEVMALQAKGYYGDGMWSSGTRLADSAKIVPGGLMEDDLPEYMCGGAQNRARPAMRKRRQRPVAGPSMLTGPQTAKRRKAGSRVTAASTFSGSGQILNADDDEKGKGTGFRKKAGSKRAREERALAAERRLLAMQGEGESKTTSPTQDPEEEVSDIDLDELRETDRDRHQAMMTSMDASEADNLRTGTLTDIWRDFILPQRLTGEGDSSGSRATEDGPPRVIQTRMGDTPIITSSESTPERRRADLEPSKIKLGEIAHEELRLVEQESLVHTVDKWRSAPGSRLSNSTRNLIKDDNVDQIPKWSCLVCTLDNEPDHLACSACSTPRGDTHWHEHT